MKTGFPPTIVEELHFLVLRDEEGIFRRGGGFMFGLGTAAGEVMEAARSIAAKGVVVVTGARR